MTCLAVAYLITPMVAPIVCAGLAAFALVFLVSDSDLSVIMSYVAIAASLSRFDTGLAWRRAKP